LTETILNLLPLTEAEQDLFLAATSGHKQEFFPATSLRGSASPPLEKLAEATVILGCPSPDSLKCASHLKWLQTWSAGVDAYTAPGVFPPGAMLTSASGAYGQAVSEHMLAALLSMMKRLPAYRDNQLLRRWQDEGAVKTLVGETVLILGTGDLGRHFAALVQALGASPVGLNRHPERQMEPFAAIHAISELDVWLPRAGVVASTLPGGPETWHILDTRRLALMRPDAILINAGRGTNVDCIALAERLKAHLLWGAVLDVTEPEPLPPDHPLWECGNLLLTPHVAGGDHLPQTLQNVVSIVLENLKRYLRGQPLRHQVL